MDLNPKQLIFASEYMRTKNGRQAAIAAGYSERSADSQASRMLKNVKVKQYLDKREANIDKDLREMFVDEAVNAFNVLLEIMHKREAMDKDRLVAARDLLDRAGYKPVERIAGSIVHSYEEQLQDLIGDE